MKKDYIYPTLLLKQKMEDPILVSHIKAFSLKTGVLKFVCTVNPTKVGMMMTIVIQDQMEE